MQQAQTLTWDETEIANARAAEFLAAEIAETEEEAFSMAISDMDVMQWEFDDFKEQLKAILDDISPEGFFYVEGRNMGWRHLSGNADIKADSAEGYIEKAFPKTSEWTFRGTYDPQKKALDYTLYHHDAPTGEFYTVIAHNEMVLKRSK